MKPSELAKALPAAALAFRGYNVTNLGRSRELLLHPAYASVVGRHLSELSAAGSEMLGRRIDLLARVRAGEETSLATYADAIVLIVAMQSAQLELLQQHFGIDYRRAQLSFGYSLGEIAALVAGGTLHASDALHIPLSLADDCVALAADVTLGVVFTRASELPLEGVRQACLSINQEGRGVIGISSHLAPNSVLLLGQGNTLDRLLVLVRRTTSERVYLRKNEHRWPPLHTPITWDRHIPDRAARLMHTLPVGAAPRPGVLSLVTGQFSYTPTTTRDLLHRWVHQPQRLWDAVYTTLASGIETVIHIGPEPNLVPATFKRLADNVIGQLAESLSLRALSAAAQRAWLQRLLPERAALLRAPYVRQVILEDWLLENGPS